MQDCASRIAKRIAERTDVSTEEDVRIACELIFQEEFPKIGIPYDPKYEVSISNGRLDALFNTLIIEYKKRGLLEKSFEAFLKDKEKYIESLSKKLNVEPSQIVCVLLDGASIGFFRVSDSGALLSSGPFEVNEASVERLIRYAQSTKKKALTDTNIINSFGHGSQISRSILTALYTSLSTMQNRRTNMFFCEWRRLFGQVTGKLTDDSIRQEAKAYDLHLTNQEDAVKFIFALHTMFALVIKHIALYVLRAKESQCSLAEEIRQGKDIKELSYKLESAEEYKALGINNFLEGDYFCWYLFEWSNDLNAAIRGIVNELDEYEPHTARLKPEAIRDLIKGLYEGLLSKRMRHSLGEYYSPDWMAQYVLEESGYKPGMRLLDPTCGSGTFLVLAIQSSIAKGIQLKQILHTICGIDMNPLAVLAARTNYILAIEPLLHTENKDIDIPVYLGDAIFSPVETDGFYTYYLDTDQGRINMRIPAAALKIPGLFASILTRISSIIDQKRKKQIIGDKEAEEILRQYVIETETDLGLGDIHDAILDLYRTIDKLEEKKWDGIWCNVIKNYFATARFPFFDVIVGNPPWVRWSELPEAYRESIKDFCKRYNLFSSDKYVGGVESDISTMVLYSAADKWLKDSGTLSMLITRSVFKTESSEGFRNFVIPNTKVSLKVQSVDDFTALRPFENAVNKPALITLKKNSAQTEYPIAWREWHSTKSISPSTPYHEVRKRTTVQEKLALPIGGKGSPWLTVPEDRLSSCLALTKKEQDSKAYYPRKGICTDLNGVYFGTVSRGVFTNSFGITGKTKTMQPEKVKIENDLLYPIARGREISPFSWNGTGQYGIVPQTGMHGFSVQHMAIHYPRALAYLSKYQELLKKRSSYNRYLKKDPFYTCWNVGTYSFARYKVCWSEISNRLKACVIGDYMGKTVVPDHKIFFVPTDDEKEAYYLCAVLNSPSVEEIVMNYAENTQIGTHIFDYVRIPKFDPGNQIHMKMSTISKSAHEKIITAEAARQGIEEIIASI